MGDVMVNPNELVSVQEAALKLGLHRATVYEWLDKGKIKGIEIAGVKFISKSEVERLQKETSGI